MENVNAKVLSIVASEKQTPGWPDRFVSHVLWQGFIEIKRLSNDLTTLQRDTIYQLNRHNYGSAFVLWLEEAPLSMMRPAYLQSVDFRIRAGSDEGEGWPSWDISDCHNAIELLKRLQLLTNTLRNQ